MSQINQFQKLYENRDYDTAKKWLIENKSDFDQDIYHYNMGVVEFKLLKFAKARYHFEMAKAQGMWTPSLIKNLESTASNLGVQEIESGDNFSDYYYQVGVGSSYEGLGIFGLAILLIVLVMKFMKRINFSHVILFTALGFLPLVLKYFLFSSYYYAIPLETQGVYEGPSKVFERSTELPVGAKLIVEDTEQNWSKVVAPSKAAGWIERNQFKSFKL